MFLKGILRKTGWVEILKRSDTDKDLKIEGLNFRMGKWKKLTLNVSGAKDQLNGAGRISGAELRHLKVVGSCW